jgi:hypothetical protein
MTPNKNWMGSLLVLALWTICIVFAASANAQVQTKTTTREGQSSQAVRVERGEVLAVEGNDLLGASHSWRDSSQTSWSPTPLGTNCPGVAGETTIYQHLQDPATVRPRRCTNL